MAKQKSTQGCLFEEDFLRRTLGAIANSPEVALTELVANAWDAGAREVQIVVPEEYDGKLMIRDDGTGMTADQFRHKWMTLGYDRIRHQGGWADFPAGVSLKRPAYGRNGVGRHGMLCFASTYEVKTRQGGVESTFEVETTSGENPFRIARATSERVLGHGTELSCRVERNLPSLDRVSAVLSARFLHDPQFRVTVNGTSVPLAEHKGLINHRHLEFGDGCKAEAYFVDSTRAAKSTQYQGVAFWVGGRLVGDPGWAARNTVFLDGRTSIAKRFTVIVRTEDLFEDVLPDWTGFRKSPRVDALFESVAAYVQEVYGLLSEQKLQDTKESVFRENAESIRSLPSGSRLGVESFVETITRVQPTIQPESLSAAVQAIIEIEKTRTGSALVEKIARLSDDDVAGLDRLLSDWTVRDALTVLDELDRRLSVAHAISKFCGDPKVDELHVLHPLVTESRWLFGLEFDTPEFVANVTLGTAMREIFKKRILGSEIENPRKRADLIVLADATICGVATEQLEDNSMPVLRDVLLIELKRGASEITRDHVNQATGYVEDLIQSNLLDGRPKLRMFVVGHTVSDKVITEREVGGQGRVEVATFNQLVRKADRRLLRLRERLAGRYEQFNGDKILARVLAEPQQMPLTPIQ